MPPLLSVIVANYNHEEYLDECLESILGQTLKDLEVVVYDDASTDGSVARIREWQRCEPERIRLIPGRRRRGPAFARNQATQNARGRYLTTLDADDTYYDSDKLIREMTLIEKAFNDLGIEAAAFSDVYEEQESGIIRKWSDMLPVRQGWIMESILMRDGFIPHNYLISRCAYDRIGGYDPRLSTHEDWDLKIRLAGILPFFYTGTPGIVYRRHESGLSRTRHQLRMCNLWRVFRRNLYRLPPGKREAARRTFADLMKNRENVRFHSPNADGISAEGKENRAGWDATALWRRLFCGRIDLLRKGRKSPTKG